MLTRTWISAGGEIGNCLNTHSWYTFGSDGSVIERDIDENACSGTRLLNKLTGVYTLRDRVLELTLPGLGQGPSYLGIIVTTPHDPVAKMVERFPIIAANVSPPWTGNGHLAIDDSAYTGTDGAHYESHRYVRLDAASGSRIFEQDATFDVTVTPSLPLAPGQTCKVQVDFTLALFDAAATVTVENDTFRLTYDAISAPPRTAGCASCPSRSTASRTTRPTPPGTRCWTRRASGRTTRRASRTSSTRPSSGTSATRRTIPTCSRRACRRRGAGWKPRGRSRCSRERSPPLESIERVRSRGVPCRRMILSNDAARTDRATRAAAPP